MWVNSKQAAEFLGVKYETLRKAAFRAKKTGKKICTFNRQNCLIEFCNGRGGASGKVLQIWIDDSLIKAKKDELNICKSEMIAYKNSEICNVHDVDIINFSKEYKNEKDENKGCGSFAKTREKGLECENNQKRNFSNEAKRCLDSEVFQSSNDLNANFGKFASASDDKKELALVKKMIVNEWSKAKGKIKEADFIEYINAKKIYSIKLTANKLYAWQRAYKNGGIDALIDERKSNKRTEIQKLGLEETIIKLIHAQKGRINAYNIYKMLNYHVIYSGEFNHNDFMAKKDEVLSYEVVNRFVKSYLDKNPLLKVLIEKGEDGAISKYMPALGVSNWAVTSINQVVEIDASPLDVICNASDLCEKIGFKAVNNIFKDKDEFESFVKEWQKRYTIIGLIDTYSGVASFHISESENSTAIARATAKYIARYGKMAVIKGDNGKAFKSKANFSFLAGIDVKYEAVRAYSGWLKPYVEKNFGSLQNGLSEWLRGYIGHDIKQRQAIEFFFSKKERRLKKGYKTNLKSLKSISELGHLIDEYTEKFLNNRYLERLGKTCAEAYNEKISEAVGVSELELSLYLAKAQNRKVLKKGVSVDGLWYKNISMFEHSEVKLRANLNNIKEQFVFDMDDKFIGVASVLDLENGESIEVAKATQKIFSKKVKQTKEKMAKDRESAEEFMTNYVLKVEANRAMKPKIKPANTETNNILEKDRNLTKNAMFSDEYISIKKDTKPKIKGFFEMAKAKAV